MVLTFGADGGGSFMTGDLTVKVSRETTSTLSALNLPWYFEREPDPHFYLAGSTHWSTALSLNATLPTSAPFYVKFSSSRVLPLLHPNFSPVKAALRAIQFRSTAIGQFTMTMSLSIQGEHECDILLFIL
jgi:hypothetical protein